MPKKLYSAAPSSPTEGKISSKARLKRRIRSYVLRQGRTTPAQKRALDELYPRYGVPFAERPLNPHELLTMVLPAAAAELRIAQWVLAFQFS